LLVLGFLLPGSAAQADDLLRSMHTEEWLDLFDRTVEFESRQLNVLPAAVEIVLELVVDSPLPDDPLQAARFVLDLALRAEAAFRQGSPESVVRLLVEYQIALAASQGFLPAHERATPRRLRGQTGSGGFRGGIDPWDIGDTEEQRRWRGSGE